MVEATRFCRVKMPSFSLKKLLSSLLTVALPQTIEYSSTSLYCYFKLAMNYEVYNTEYSFAFIYPEFRLYTLLLITLFDL